jgi:large subunit ribosomal protein L9
VKVVLLEDVKGLGQKGDIVDVKDGYARNYLLPRNLVKEATPAVLRSLQQQEQAQAQRRAREEQEAAALAEKLAKTTVRLEAKAGANDRLFGSITSQDIAAALAAKNIKIDRRKIELSEPIRALGSFEVPVRIYQDTLASLKVEVVGKD